MRKKFRQLSIDSDWSIFMCEVSHLYVKAKKNACYGISFTTSYDDIVYLCRIL